MTFILDEIKIIAIASYITYWLQCLLFNYIFCDVKRKYKFADILLVVLYVILLASGVIDEDAVIISVFMFANLLVISDISFKGKIVNVLKIIFFINCFCYVIQVLMSIITGIDIASMSNFAWLIGSIIFLVVLFIIAGCKKYKPVKLHVKGISGFSRIWIYGAMVVMGISMPSTVVALSYAASYVNTAQYYTVTNILSLLAFSSMIFLVLFIFYMNNTNRKIKKSLETERLLKEVQKNYYEAMLKKEDETRRFRHDIVNHLMCMGGLAEKEDKQMVINYIRQLQEQVASIQQTCYTVGNEVIDATLNGILPQLKDIEVIVKGTCTENIAIDYVDLCTVVANLLQNAKEELERLHKDEKYLKVIVSQGKQNMELEIVNSSGEKAEDKKSHLPISSKEDKRNHGIGLRNVKETIERNHGTFSWECKNGEFKVAITLPISKEKSKN